MNIKSLEPGNFNKEVVIKETKDLLEKLNDFLDEYRGDPEDILKLLSPEVVKNYEQLEAKMKKFNIQPQEIESSKEELDLFRNYYILSKNERAPFASMPASYFEMCTNMNQGYLEENYNITAEKIPIQPGEKGDSYKITRCRKHNGPFNQFLRKGYLDNRFFDDSNKPIDTSVYEVHPGQNLVIYNNGDIEITGKPEV